MTIPQETSWTEGGSGICYQHCIECSSTWYFRRAFCPRCGNSEPQNHVSAGKGVVYAKTVVVRAPSQELRQLAPYSIILVDMDEGFRIMAHGEEALGIGSRVTAEVHDFAGARLPYFLALDEK